MGGYGKGYLEHVLRALGLGAVDGEGIVLVVYGAPVVKVGLERRFDFPVLYKVLYEFWEGSGFMILLFCCFKSILKP